MTTQTDAVFVEVELPVRTWAVQITTNRRRDAARIDMIRATLLPYQRFWASEYYGQRITATMHRWLGRQLRRTGRRLVVVSLPKVTASEDHADYFVRNLRLLRASVDVVEPLPNVLSGERYVDARGARTLVVIEPRYSIGPPDA